MTTVIFTVLAMNVAYLLCFWLLWKLNPWELHIYTFEGCRAAVKARHGENYDLAVSGYRDKLRQALEADGPYGSVFQAVNLCMGWGDDGEYWLAAAADLVDEQESRSRSAAGRVRQ